MAALYPGEAGLNRPLTVDEVSYVTQVVRPELRHGTAGPGIGRELSPSESSQHIPGRDELRMVSAAMIRPVFPG